MYIDYLQQKKNVGCTRFSKKKKKKREKRKKKADFHQKEEREKKKLMTKLANECMHIINTADQPYNQQYSNLFLCLPHLCSDTGSSWGCRARHRWVVELSRFLWWRGGRSRPRPVHVLLSNTHAYLDTHTHIHAYIHTHFIALELRHSLLLHPSYTHAQTSTQTFAFYSFITNTTTTTFVLVPQEELKSN